MRKRHKNILLGLLVWAGLLIAVLYSPIGSPNLYTSTNYYAINQGVNFENNEIPNATKVRTAPDNNDNAPDIPNVSGTELKSSGSSGSSSSATASSQGSSYAGQSPSYLSNNSSGSAGGGGVVMIAGGSARSSASSSGVTMTNGITSIATTSTDLTNGSAKQSATTYKAGTGGTDPGGDPTGNPIPVGNGWGVFVFFGVCYAAYKKRGFILSRLNFAAQRK